MKDTQRRRFGFGMAALTLGSLAAVSIAAPADDDRETSRRRAMASITADDAQKLVDHLASDEMNGRHYRSDEARQAAQWIADRFEAANLAPLGEDGTWFQSIGIEEAAPNVVGLRKGTGERYLLLTAHYDHLRPRGEGEDPIFNGADDNASGTSAIIEIAGAFAALDEQFEASIIFVAFTAEEAGLRGSRYFAAHPPMDLEHALGIINLDMVSRGEANLIFCEGGDSAPDLLAAIKRANETIGLDVRYDVHPEWMRQSDQWSLLRAGVPALYFGVEDHPDYHKVSDHADKIIPELIERVARLTFLAAVDVASEPKEPKHNPPMKPGLQRINKGGGEDGGSMQH